MSAHLFAPSNPFPPQPTSPAAIPFHAGPHAGWRGPPPQRGPSQGTPAWLVLLLTAFVVLLLLALGLARIAVQNASVTAAAADAAVETAVDAADGSPDAGLPSQSGAPEVSAESMTSMVETLDQTTTTVTPRPRPEVDGPSAVAGTTAPPPLGPPPPAPGGDAAAAQVAELFSQVNAAALLVTAPASPVITIGPDDSAAIAFELTAGQPFTVEADTVGDPTLVLFGPDGQVVATDEDGGFGTDASVALTAAPQTGRYVAVAADRTGQTVDVEFNLVADSAIFEVIDVLGQVVADGGVAIFPVEAFAGEELTALAIGLDGPVLLGIGQDGVILESGAPFGEDPSTPLASFIVPADGSYDIVVFGDTGTVTFDLYAEVRVS